MVKVQRLTGRFFFIFSFFIITKNCCAQSFALTPSNEYRPDRLRKVVVAESVFGLAASAGLYYLWYKKFPRSRFHFFNDNNEWLQIDKVGHATTAYNIAFFQHDIMRWCGVSPNRSILIASVSALSYMSIIEVLDGFSSQWGFSKGDMLANITGTTLFAAQQKYWHQQRTTFRFSYHTSPFAIYNPAALGNNFKSRLLKDYNGQTYWLSFNIRSFLPQRSTFPAWANMAVGYGGDGMTGATSNPTEVAGKPIPTFKRIRQYYLAPDADFFRINSASPFINNITYISRLSKIPAPALEFNSDKKFVFHPFYY